MHQISKDLINNPDAYFTVLTMEEKFNTNLMVRASYSIRRLHSELSLSKRKSYLENISDEDKKPIASNDTIDRLFGGDKFEIIRSTYDLRRLGLHFGNCLYREIIDESQWYVLYKNKYIFSYSHHSNKVKSIKGRFNDDVSEEIKQEIYDLFKENIREYKLDIIPPRGLTGNSIWVKYDFTFPNIG